MRPILETLANQFDVVKKIEIERFMAHATRQIDQTRRRVILGEVIPHGEKVFSIFEPHIEWISQGKAGVAVELGVKVCILEDQHQFILHHQVMQKCGDDQFAVPMVAAAKKRFPSLNACRCRLQAGKSTLLRNALPDWPMVPLEDPDLREFARLPTRREREQYGQVRSPQSAAYLLRKAMLK